jgi:hypothetical protein
MCRVGYWELLQKLRRGLCFQNRTIAVRILEQRDVERSWSQESPIGRWAKRRRQKKTLSREEQSYRRYRTDRLADNADISMIVLTAGHMCRSIELNSVHLNWYTTISNTPSMMFGTMTRFEPDSTDLTHFFAIKVIISLSVRETMSHFTNWTVWATLLPFHFKNSDENWEICRNDRQLSIIVDWFDTRNHPSQIDPLKKLWFDSRKAGLCLICPSAWSIPNFVYFHQRCQIIGRQNAASALFEITDWQGNERSRLFETSLNALFLKNWQCSQYSNVSDGTDRFQEWWSNMRWHRVNAQDFHLVKLTRKLESWISLQKTVREISIRIEGEKKADKNGLGSGNTANCEIHHRTEIKKLTDGPKGGHIGIL